MPEEERLQAPAVSTLHPLIHCTQERLLLVFLSHVLAGKGKGLVEEALFTCVEAMDIIKDVLINEIDTSKYDQVAPITIFVIQYNAGMTTTGAWGCSRLYLYKEEA